MKPDFTKIAFDPQHSDIQQSSEWETQEGIQLNSSYSEECKEFRTFTIGRIATFLRGPYATMYAIRPGRFASMQVLTQRKNQILLQKKSGSRSESCRLHLTWLHIEDTILIIRVEGDVGKAGVAIDSVEDMKLLDQIPLNEMSVSTMNGTAIPIMAFYIVATEEQGRPIAQRHHSKRYPEGVHGA